MNRPLREVARECKIPESTLRGWKRKWEDDGVLPKAKKRAKGAGAKPILPYTKEEELVEWVKDGRKKGLAITPQLVRTKARVIFPQEEFKATHGWYYGFEKRWDLTTRTRFGGKLSTSNTI